MEKSQSQSQSESGAPSYECSVSRWLTATRQVSPSTPSVAYFRLTRRIPVYLSRNNPQ